MAIYQYYEILPDGSEGEIFEVNQKMTDSPIKIHPISGNPVKKIIQTPSINSQYSNIENKKRLDPRNLENKGFTQYTKDKSTGRYFKSAGNNKHAPNEIDPKN